MSVANLTVTITPPVSPTDTGPEELRQTVEKYLGIRLPQDFVDISTTYGSGMFADGQFWCLNPYASWYRSNVDQICDVLRTLKETEGNDFIPYDIFPEQGGLLPWGAEANGHGMFWLMQGSSDEWPIVLFNRDTNMFEKLEMSVSTFLVKIFSCELECILWSSETQNTFAHHLETA